MSTPSTATSPAMPELEPSQEHHSVPHGVPSELDSDPMAEFNAKMRNHFAGRLGDKWDCAIPGHTVCVLTVDRGHHQLSEESINLWIDALCRGEATTAQPPDGVLNSNSTNDPSRPSTPRAVSIAPSRRRHGKSSILAASASLRQSLEYTSYSSSASGSYGPGYRSGQAIEWLGRKVLNGVDAILIRQRVWRYQYRLHQWSKDPVRNADIAYKVLENVLDMLRPYNSRHIHRYAERLNRKANNFAWRISAHIYQVTYTIGRLSFLMLFSDDEKVEDLTYEINRLLTKSPLSLQGPQSIANVVNAILHEIAYTPRSDSAVHYMARWMLHDIRTFWPETVFDTDDIQQLRTRRLHSRNDDPQSCFPSELEFFVAAEIRDSSFRDIVLGPHGVPGLFLVAESLLCHNALSEDGWSILTDIFWTLSEFLKIKWICDIVESKDVKIIVETLRRLPESGPKPGEWLVSLVVSSLEHIITNNPATVAILIANDAGAVLRECLASASRDAYYAEDVRAMLRKLDESQESPSGVVEGTDAQE